MGCSDASILTGIYPSHLFNFNPDTIREIQVAQNLQKLLLEALNCIALYLNRDIELHDQFVPSFQLGYERSTQTIPHLSRNFPANCKCPFACCYGDSPGFRRLEQRPGTSFHIAARRRSRRLWHYLDSLHPRLEFLCSPRE